MSARFPVPLKPEAGGLCWEKGRGEKADESEPFGPYKDRKEKEKEGRKCCFHTLLTRVHSLRKIQCNGKRIHLVVPFLSSLSLTNHKMDSSTVYTCISLLFCLGSSPLLHPFLPIGRGPPPPPPPLLITASRQTRPSAASLSLSPCFSATTAVFFFFSSTSANELPTAIPSLEGGRPTNGKLPKPGRERERGEKGERETF